MAATRLIPMHVNKGKTAADRFHELSETIRSFESRLKEIGNLKKAITDYSKTRSVYEAYRKAGYSRKFFEEHREEITIHKAAKSIFGSLPGKRFRKNALDVGK